MKLRKSLCIVAVVVGFAMTASAGTILVTDEYGTPVHDGVMRVTFETATAGVSNIAEQTIQATELRAGGYTVPGITGRAYVHFDHPAYGVVQAKVDFAGGETVELVVAPGESKGYTMHRLGEVAESKVAAGGGRSRFGAGTAKAGGPVSSAAGATCATATDIPWALITPPGGYTDLGATNGDDRPVSCGLNGSDGWYKFTVPVGSPVTGVNLTTCQPNSPNDTVLQVKDAACNPRVPANCNDDNCAPVPPGGNVFNSTLTNVPVTAGTTYTIQIDNWASTAPANFQLNVGLPFELDPPVDGCTDEGEPACGLSPLGCTPLDFTNGGCNINPPLFSDISCGETICGTYGNCGAARDTDWYEIVETSIRIQTWCCIGEGPTLLGLVNNGGGSGNCPATAFQAFATASPGNEACVTQLVFPGTWWWFAATSNFSGTPCGAEYQCTLECVCPEACDGPAASSN